MRRAAVLMTPLLGKNLLKVEKGKERGPYSSLFPTSIPRPPMVLKGRGTYCLTRPRFRTQGGNRGGVFVCKRAYALGHV